MGGKAPQKVPKRGIDMYVCVNIYIYYIIHSHAHYVIHKQSYNVDVA